MGNIRAPHFRVFYINGRLGSTSDSRRDLLNTIGSQCRDNREYDYLGLTRYQQGFRR